MRPSRQTLRRLVPCVASAVLLIAGGLGALQVPAVQRYLVYSPAVDAFYRRLTPDPNPYPTFRQSLINNFLSRGDLLSAIPGNEHVGRVDDAPGSIQIDIRHTVR